VPPEPVYEQNFDNPVGPHGDVYFNTASVLNGVTDGTGTGASFKGNGSSNGILASPGQGGSKYCLVDFLPPGALYPSTMDVWGTQTGIAVEPNTTYTFSFYLKGVASVAGDEPVFEPIIDGTPLSSGVKPNPGWQQFSFNWNSGPETIANIELEAVKVAPNEAFALDTITLTRMASVSELPASVLILTGLAHIRRDADVPRKRPPLDYLDVFRPVVSPSWLLPLELPAAK
jgi:hypothetical protein